MGAKRQRHIPRRDAAAIVAHANKLPPGTLDFNCDLA